MLRVLRSDIAAIGTPVGKWPGVQPGGLRLGRDRVERLRSQLVVNLQELDAAGLGFRHRRFRLRGCRHLGRRVESHPA